MDSSFENFEFDSKTTIKELTRDDKKLGNLVNKLQTAKLEMNKKPETEKVLVKK